MKLIANGKKPIFRRIFSKVAPKREIPCQFRVILVRLFTSKELIMILNVQMGNVSLN